MATKFRDLKAGDKVYEIYGGYVIVHILKEPFHQNPVGDWIAKQDDDLHVGISKSVINKDYQKSTNFCADEEVLKVKLKEWKELTNERYKSEIENLKKQLALKQKQCAEFNETMDAQLNGDYSLYKKRFGL